VRAFIYWVFLAFELAPVAKSAPISESELKNTLRREIGVADLGAAREITKD
jgi:hypothetical protein